MDRLLDALPGLLLLLSAGLIVAMVCMSWYTYHRLRTPPRRTAAWAISRGVASQPSELDSPLEHEEWSFTSRRGWFKGLAIPVWDIVGLDRSGPVLIVTPGWGDSRVGSLRRVEHLASVCSRVIAWDPPGLGEAPGRTTLGVHEPELLCGLIEHIDTPHDRIVLYGSSMGAGISIATGARSDPPLRAVIAEAPYIEARTPAYNVLRESGLPWRVNGPLAFALLGFRLGIGWRWRSFDRAHDSARLCAPLLVIHGTEDTTCPLLDSRRIARASDRGSLVEIHDAGHNNLWTEEPYMSACSNACEGFIRRLETTATDTPASSSG
ncbi:MAG: alpha/beta hydrolase [Planctomycetota bacterium]|jgi:pimeloyl-ACP methyl ester carboxylesterase